MGEARAGVENKIDIFARGELEHAKEVVLSLLKIANGDGGVKSPAPRLSAVSLTRLSLPLLGSILSGCFTLPAHNHPGYEYRSPAIHEGCAY